MTHAAQRMNMTQPAMSFQIRELEKEVQLSLFDRDRNGIYLTEAGRVMRDGFVRILDQYHKLLEDARACAYGKNRLTIGYHGPLDWAGVLRVVRLFSSKYPEIEVAVLQQELKELADYIEQDVLDIAFLETAELASREKLCSRPLFSEKACFAMAPYHPLAKRHAITSDQLANETILMNNHPSNEMTNIIARLVKSGIRMDSFRFFDHMETTMAMAAAGQGIAVIPCSFRLESSALQYVEYASEEFYMDYSLVWKKDSRNESVRLFVQEASSLVWPYPEEMDGTD